MMLINEYAESKLAEALEELKAGPATARCLSFRLAGSMVADDFKETFFVLAQRHLPAVDAHIYLCGDGDIFILAPTLPSKEGKEFILSIASVLGRPAGEEWVSFHELPLHVHALLNAVEQKLDRLHKAEEARRRLLEQQQHERKRHAILNGGTLGGQENIQSRRAGHKTPEMMIIEDDAFSRRLVENVLQNKYSLTALGEATYALDTYSRIAPDLLFLDINLPDVTGHELLEKILTLDPHAYVIMLSGNCDRENITQAMSKGAKGFVAKPFTKEKLFQYIERCPTITHQGKDL